MARLTVVIVLLCLGTLACIAQDSIKKKAPVKVPPKYTYKRHSYTYYARKADSVAHAPVEPGLVKTDSTPAVAATAQPDKTLYGQYQYLLTGVPLPAAPYFGALEKRL